VIHVTADLMRDNFDGIVADVRQAIKERRSLTLSGQ